MVSSISGNSFSSASLIQMRQEMFNMIDQNSDGALDKSELQGLSGKSSSEIDSFISKLDTDGNSAISQQEFEAGLSKLFQEMKSQSGDGASAAPPPPPPPPSSEDSSDSSSGIFDSLDTNKDGYVSLDELKAGNVPDAEKIFSEIDTDGDNKISQSESDAFEQKMKENGPNGNSQTAGVDSLQSMQAEFLSRMIDMITGSTSSELSGGTNSYYA
jgi:Ca2+-binding EF-hand superfamily protein